jgi:hypothetical protein
MNKNQLYVLFYLWLIIELVSIWLPIVISLNVYITALLEMCSFGTFAILLLGMITAIYPSEKN